MKDSSKQVCYICEKELDGTYIDYWPVFAKEGQYCVLGTSYNKNDKKRDRVRFYSVGGPTWNVFYLCLTPSNHPGVCWSCYNIFCFYLVDGICFFKLCTSRTLKMLDLPTPLCIFCPICDCLFNHFCKSLPAYPKKTKEYTILKKIKRTTNKYNTYRFC